MIERTGMNSASMMSMQKNRPKMSDFDSNQDQLIDKSEFSGFNQKMNETSGKSMDSDEMFGKFDSNSDGQIDQTEMESMRKNKGKGMGPPPMKFGNPESMKQSLMDIVNNQSDEEESEDPLDENGDGIVDANELKASLFKIFSSYQNTGSAETYQSAMNLVG